MMKTKKMKRTLYGFLVLFAASIFQACDTEPENIGYKPVNNTDYAAIRAYKASDHEIMFGWFGNWDGGSASASGSLMSLPDSVDMVSIWGSPWPLNDKQIPDMKNVQTIKGTKVLACIFTPYLGRYVTPEGEDPVVYWNWGTTIEENRAAAKEYGKALAQEVLKWGYDGLDIDNEGESGTATSFYNNSARFSAFVEGLAEYLGPMSGSGKILQLDGWLTNGMLPEMDQYFTYFVSQAYYETSYSRYDSRFNEIANFFSGTRAELAKKFVVTEDFERHWSDGGPNFRQRDGSYVRSAIGMAGWRPQENGVDLPKGGAGLYHIENEYRSPIKPYNYTRDMVQIMNVSVKPVEQTPEETPEP